jgi:hypothetical protein
MRVVVTVVTLILFAVALFVLIVVSAIVRPQEVVHAEFALTWIQRGLGTFLAVAAGLGLLILGMTAPTPERMALLCLPLLGGLLLVSPHWATALALGALGLALLLRPLYVRPPLPVQPAEGASRTET